MIDYTGNNTPQKHLDHLQTQNSLKILEFLILLSMWQMLLELNNALSLSMNRKPKLESITVSINYYKEIL